MTNNDTFDLLIVYSGKIAVSACNSGSILPFSPRSRHASYNQAYAYFLSECTKSNIKAAFTTSDDIIGPGKCSSYWLYEKRKWIKINRLCFSNFIFDKFSPMDKIRKEKRELLFSSVDITPYNDAKLFQLFFDKHKMYKTLRQFTIPTVSIKNQDPENIAKAFAKLRVLVSTHAHYEDFSRDVVIKDRFGAGGINVHKLNSQFCKQTASLMEKNKKTSFIIQPFARFEKGYSYNGLSSPVDIRLIYLRGRLVQTYIRIAKPRDFRCNEHQGGTLIYVSKKDIPTNILKLSQEVTQVLNEKVSLFALDFIVSDNNNVYLLEGNTGPGLDWNLEAKVNERRAKRLIQIIIKDIALRLSIPQPKPINYKDKNIEPLPLTTIVA